MLGDLSLAPWRAEGDSLAEVLRRYPDEVLSEFPRGRFQGQPVRLDRRAIKAHYALLQELQGAPDVDPADSATVEQIISNQGVEWARVRTGSALNRYRNVWPDLSWSRSQAPERWTTEYEGLLRAGRGD
jgi:hypothetical protein